MSDVGDLRRRAARWRQAAQETRRQCRILASLTELRWRSPAAEHYRRLSAERLSELQELAEREDAVADLLDQFATAVERAA